MVDKKTLKQIIDETPISDIEEFSEGGFKHYIITTTDKLANVKDYIKRKVYQIEKNQRVKREQTSL